VATEPNEIDEIRRQMAQIRRELHEDVQDVVAGAEAVADWRRYIRMYPWAAVGVAVAVGYLVVPKRRRGVPRDVARQSDVAEMRAVLQEAREPEEKKQRKSLLGAAFGMLLPLGWRVAQNYAMGYLEQWIAQQQERYMAATGPAGAHPTQSQSQSRAQSPGGPGWPGGPPPGPSTSPGGPGRPGGPRGF